MPVFANFSQLSDGLNFLPQAAEADEKLNFHQPKNFPWNLKKNVWSC